MRYSGDIGEIQGRYSVRLMADARRAGLAGRVDSSRDCLGWEAAGISDGVSAMVSSLEQILAVTDSCRLCQSPAFAAKVVITKIHRFAGPSPSLVFLLACRLRASRFGQCHLGSSCACNRRALYLMHLVDPCIPFRTLSTKPADLYLDTLKVFRPTKTSLNSLH